MLTRNYNIVLAVIGIFLCSILLTNALTNCDPKTCTGPLYYYKELGCIPIYENASSCCPIRYNCDHWKNLPDNKCFVNGREYESGEILAAGEIGESCSRCFCNGGNSYPSCVSSSCMGSKMGCYLKKTAFDCCSKIEVCPEKEEDIPTCTVDGKTYKDGERFEPLGEPAKICYCGEGYTGENTEPYCITRKPGWCGNSLFAVDKIRENCAPVYAHDSSPRSQCNRGWRCYNADTDFAIDHYAGPPETSEPEDPSTLCRFGNLTMRIGQILSPSTDDKSNMECACEVPPVVTCRD